VSDRAGLAAALEQVALARAIPVQGSGVSVEYAEELEGDEE
jgi:hypothetical protein